MECAHFLSILIIHTSMASFFLWIVWGSTESPTAVLKAVLFYCAMVLAWEYRDIIWLYLKSVTSDLNNILHGRRVR